MKDWQEYERLVHDIAHALYQDVEGQPAISLGYGNRNMWTGISGYKHQIDVSIAGEGNAILVECKRWQKRVKVEHFLTFLARVIDIRSAETGRTLHPIIATTVGFEAGVHILANHYQIGLEVVRSASEFGMKYKHLIVEHNQAVGGGTCSLIDEYNKGGGP